MNDFGFLAGLGAAILVTPLVPILARKLGLVETAAGPCTGGVAVFAALLIGLMAAGALPPAAAMRHSSELILLLVGAASLLLGLADDWRNLPPPLKFAGQVGIATLFLAIAGPGPTGSPTWDGPTGLIWMVVFMNALALVDNMDGALAGVSFIAVMGLTALAIIHGVTGMAWLLVLAGALLGFLIFNAPPARIHLGSAGSLCLGGILAAAGWQFASDAGMPSVWLAVPLVLVYPLFDIVFVTFTRLKRRRALWEGGRDHTTDRLSTWIGGPRRALAVIYLLAVLGSAGAFISALSTSVLWLLPYWLLGLLFVGLGIRLAAVPVR